MKNEIMVKSFLLLDQVCEKNRGRRMVETIDLVDYEKTHAKFVHSWVLKLNDNASSALQIAALFHDVDRIIHPDLAYGFKGSRASKEYYQYKKDHATRSAEFICPQLENIGLHPQEIKEVTFLITHHDDTGEEVTALKNKKLNIIVAADSLAFFDSVAQKILNSEGKDRVRDKMYFMIEKMPIFARKILKKITLTNPILEEIKKEILNKLP